MKERFLCWAADIRGGDLNPVMIRELRQYTRSRFASWVVVLMLAGLLLITAGFFTATRGQMGISGMELTSGSGAEMYAAVSGVLGLASLLVALYTAQRMGNERQKDKPDLMFSTVLKPGAIVRGKLFAGMAMFGLLLSLAMPFMTMTYLLRGIDVRTILWGLLFLVVANVLSLIAAILLGCMPLGPLFRRGGIAMAGMVFWFLFVGVGAASAMFRSLGPHASPFAGVTLAVVAAVGAGVAIAFLLPYATAVLMLSPRWSNRSLPYRLTLTCIWLAGAAFVLFNLVKHGTVDEDMMAVWLMPCSFFLLIMLQIGECTAETSSDRVLAGVPRRLLGRIVCFPLFSGAPNSLVWVLALLAATHGIAFGLVLPLSSASEDLCRPMLVTTAYIVCYILTASVISRWLPKSVREGAGTPWLISLYFFASAAMVPLFFEELHQKGKIEHMPTVEFGNAFAMFRGQEEYWHSHLLVVLPWLFLLLILNCPRLLTAFERFRRPPAPPPLPEEAATSPQL